MEIVKVTCARSEIVDESEVGVYHCVSRCVRRAFLCGFDKLTKRSYEHRRRWIRARLAELVQIFSIEVIAYAILSNHLHKLVRLRPDVAVLWSAEEVARRWRLLFPLRREPDGRPAEPNELEISAIASNPARVELYRKRLTSLSWFQRCLNEKIARSANAEDGCKGRFWEGRYKCQRVYDLAAALTCAAYIDLNPIRAGMAKTLEESDHTSIQDRIHELQGSIPERCRVWETIPLLSISEISEGTLTTEEYLKLVDETGRIVRDGKGALSDEVEQILGRLKLKSSQWTEATSHISRRFRRIVGPPARLIEAASKAQKNWFQGIRAAQSIFSCV